jgi:predicted AAA+ superfamily ATPase
LEKAFDISSDTIEKFSSYLEASYCTLFLKRFSYKVKEQGKSPRKIYAIDTGLANAAGFRFSENLGRTAENIVFLELKRRQARGDEELYYWKDPHHREVDFVCKEGPKITRLIQVVWDVSRLETKQRELRSLAKAMRELDVTENLVITRDREGTEQYGNYAVVYTPLWKWLLGVE